MTPKNIAAPTSRLGSPAADTSPLSSPISMASFGSRASGIIKVGKAPQNGDNKGSTISAGSENGPTTNIGKKRARDEADDLPPNESPPPKKPSKRPAPKAKSKAVSATPPPPSTRPTRNRRAPPRLIDEPVETPKKAATPRATGSKVFEPVYITTNPKSRLVKTDIYHMLLEPTAWTCLTPAEQNELIEMLPSTTTNLGLITQHIADPDAALARPKELSAGEIFRTDVAKYQTDLFNGHLAKGWQSAAQEAMIQRAEGAFDAWKEAETELWWGQKGG